MNRDVSRRDLLKFFAATAGGITLCGDLSGATGTSQPPGAATETTEEEKRAFLPAISSITPPPPGGRVVHMHSTSATSWNGETAYWNHVDQDVVNDMVDQGIMALTGASSVSNAWAAILPNYQEGQGIAIKANLNNCYACNDVDGQIDALIQPVNSIVRGLKQIGVRETDVWVFDAIRSIPDRFVADCLYPGVRFFDRATNGCREPATWTSNDPNATVTFLSPAGIPQPADDRIPDVVINATYMINMPILKKHSLTGATLGFKNHLGTITDPAGLHEYISPGAGYFRTDYSPMVDIFRNPHIGPKTVLTIGDGLFASKTGTTRAPEPWDSFGDEVPNSLFLAQDPVAIDCVMLDLVAVEAPVSDQADAYLQVASSAGLGTFERGDPWGAGYTLIAYEKIEV